MYLKFKRLMDIVLSFIGLVILSPIFLILIIAIKIDSKGPVLFKQKRIGIKSFNILKFVPKNRYRFLILLVIRSLITKLVRS